VTTQPHTIILCGGGRLDKYHYEANQLSLIKSLSPGLSSESIVYNPFTNRLYCSDQAQCMVIDAYGLTIVKTQKPEFGAFMDYYWAKDKTLWLATRSGLLHYNDEIRHIETFNTTNGLNNDVVYAVKANRDSTLLYLSTNLGISVFDVKTKRIKNFTMADGLVESEHNGAASACDDHDIYYFGNIKGVTMFDASTADWVPAKPFLIIQSINTFDPAHQNQMNPDFIEKIDLYPENELLEIKFGLLSTSEPERLIYSYKVEGIDKDFYRSNSAFVIRFAKPRPGSYTIVIRGETTGGSFVEKRIALVVHAPYYLKWWFLIPAILIFHAFIWIIIRRIIRSRLRKKQQEIDNERRLYEQKSQIARELHDNVGARLSMMLNTVDWIGKKPKIEIQDLNEIKENTKAVIQGLRDAIWVMDKTEITVEELFDKIKYYSNQINRNYPVHLAFNEVTHQQVSLNTTQALNLFRIVQESLNNALKYANASQIMIDLSYTGEHGIVFKIKDNGKGFDPDKVIRGHGLKNLQARADEINASLSLQSNINEGTSITVTLYTV
jgi:signal transduction histidine kinase